GYQTKRHHINHHTSSCDRNNIVYYFSTFKACETGVSDRSLRRHVKQLKYTVACAQTRYYIPVLDTVPGVQCQMDPGELRDVLIDGQPRTVHFVVFVLPFSRLMYVGVRFKPLDTHDFITLHDEAFRYFGRVPEGCVYDQTKWS